MSLIIAAIDQLSGLSELRTVSGAADLPAVQERLPQRHELPAAFVIPDIDRAGDNALVGAVSQMVTTTFAVLLGLGNLAEPRGKKAAVEMETLRKAVRDRLVGWQPEESEDPILYASSRVVGFDAGVVWIEMRFIATELVRG